MTAIISQLESTAPAPLSSYSYGQEFVMVGTSLYSIAIFVESSPGAVIEMRVGESADLTTYLASDSLTCVYGENLFVFDLSGLTDGGTYYFGLAEVSSTGPTIGRSDADPYGSGYSRYAGSGWNLNATGSDHDLQFVIYDSGSTELPINCNLCIGNYNLKRRLKRKLSIGESGYYDKGIVNNYSLVGV